jgi:hypothetical protein
VKVEIEDIGILENSVISPRFIKNEINESIKEYAKGE